LRCLGVTSAVIICISLLGCTDGEDSLTSLQTRVRHNPESLDARLALADTHLDNENYHDAFVHYKAARALDQSSYPAAYGLARAHEGLGDVAAGLSVVDEALRLKSDSAEALNLRGRLLLEDEKPGEATRDFERALDLEPGNAEALKKLPVAYLRQGETRKAETTARTALKQLPDEIETHLNLATILSARGQDAEAEKLLREALELAPTDHRPPLWLAELLVEQERNLEEAVELADRAAGIEPGDGSADAIGAVALRKMGREEAALTRLHIAASEHPRNVKLWLMLASIYKSRGDEEAAAECATMAVRFAPRRRAQQ
jgi:tetratricopeptide (TPR) repeat protein